MEVDTLIYDNGSNEVIMNIDGTDETLYVSEQLDAVKMNCSSNSSIVSSSSTGASVELPRSIEKSPEMEVNTYRSILWPSSFLRNSSAASSSSTGASVELHRRTVSPIHSTESLEISSFHSTPTSKTSINTSASTTPLTFSNASNLSSTVLPSTSTSITSSLPRITSDIQLKKPNVPVDVNFIENSFAEGKKGHWKQQKLVIVSQKNRCKFQSNRKFKKKLFQLGMSLL